METIICERGGYAETLVQLRDSDGVAVTGKYTGTEVLALTIWAGDDRSPVPLTTSGVFWSDANAGTIHISIEQVDTSTLDSFTYLLNVHITDGGKVRKCFESWLKIEAAPGTAVAPNAYCTADRMKRFAGQILDNLQDESDQAGFAEQRAQASRWVDRTILARAKKVLSDQLQRHIPILVVDPIRPTYGVDAGPMFGASIYPETTLQGQMDTIRNYLGGTNSKLTLIEPEDSAIIDATALKAIAIVLDRQFGPTGEDTPYQKLATKFHARAIDTLYSTKARIADTNTTYIYV